LGGGAADSVLAMVLAGSTALLELQWSAKARRENPVFTFMVGRAMEKSDAKKK